MIFGAASCQKDLVKGQKGDCKVCFNIEVPNDAETKGDISDGKTVDQLIYEVYVGDQMMYEGAVDMETAGSRQFVLELDLVTNQTYDLLFWAQKKGTHYYDTNDLRNVSTGYDRISISDPHYYGYIFRDQANNEGRDAFCGSRIGFKATGISTSETIKLYRPLAQINFGSSPKDWEKAKPFVQENGLKSRMIIAQVPTRFNVKTGDVINSNYQTVQFAYTLSPASEDKDGKNDFEKEYISYNSERYAWVGMNYVFAPKDESTLNSVSAYFVHDKNNENSAIVKEVINVPYKQNYRTNILGEIFTGGNKFTVVIEPDFVNDDYTVVDPLEFAFRTGGQISLKENVHLLNPLVLADGKELTVDLNGKTITVDNSTEIWNTSTGAWSLMSVQGGANLTIVDSKGTGSVKAKENDSYVIDVRDGSTLTIEGGNFVGNISAVYVKEGTANIKGGHYSLMQLSEPANGGDERFTLNCVDANYKAGTANINVTGGSFVNFNPADNLAEGSGTRFVPAEGYDVTSVESETNGKTITTYTVAKTAAVTE